MINIAVMGYGTVGSGVVEVINTNGARINQRIGEELNIKYVLDMKDFPGDPVQDKIIHDFETIVSDEESTDCCGSDGWYRTGVYICKTLPAGRKECGNIK